jgi:hypothetical protein
MYITELINPVVPLCVLNNVLLQPALLQPVVPARAQLLNRRASNEFALSEIQEAINWTSEFSSPGYVKVTRNRSGRNVNEAEVSVVIQSNRTNKVYKLLNRDHIRNVLSPDACRCKAQCDSKFNTS